jgi:hypothetical protein
MAGGCAVSRFVVVFWPLPVLRARAYLARRGLLDCWESVVARSKGARVLASGGRLDGAKSGVTERIAKERRSLFREGLRGGGFVIGHSSMVICH